MLEPRIAVRAAILLAAGMMSSATASTIPMINLFEQTDSCAASFNYCQRGQPAFPSNFCCETTETCIPLAGSTTMMCCPAGTDCSIIAPISCNLTLQDPNYDNTAFIMTTALHGTLGHCGEGTCCPYGFSCFEDLDHGTTCKMNADQNPKPIETTPTSSTASPTASPTTSSASHSSSTVTPMTSSASGIQVIPTSSPATSSSSSSSDLPGNTAPVPTTNPDTTPSSSPATNPGGGGTPTAVIAGAAVGAVLVTAAITFIAWVFLKRSRSKRHAGEDDDRDALKLTRSTSSFGNIISNPIITETTKPMRSDFVRKSPGRSSTTGSILGSFGRSPTLVPETPTPPRSAGTTTTTVAGARVPPIRGMAQARQSSIAYGFGAPDTSPYANGPPRTPPNQREPSSISINVFADPRTVGSPPERTRSDSRQTTFSDMLRSADLDGVARGEPYVPPRPRPGLPSTPRPPGQGGTGTQGSRLRLR